MSTQVLIIGNNRKQLKASSTLLCDNGFAVTVCSDNKKMNSLIETLKPQVVFFDTGIQDASSADLYHALLDNIRFASIPVIFTLSKNDVYLVSRKRTAVREKRNVVAAGPLEALSAALRQPDQRVARFLPGSARRSACSRRA